MAIKSVVMADDGITDVTSIDLLALSPDELRRIFPAGAGGFDWMVGEIEQFWLQQTQTQDAPPKPLSLAWYARAILASIRRLRATLATGTATNLEAVVIDAIRLGKLTEEAKWRVNVGDHVRQRVKVRTTNRASARKPRPRDNTPSDRTITAVARALRRKVPYSRALYSTIWLAQMIVRQEKKGDPQAVRRRLDALKIR